MICFGICWNNEKCFRLLLDSIVDVLQHVLVKVLVSINPLKIFLELLFGET